MFTICWLDSNRSDSTTVESDNAWQTFELAECVVQACLDKGYVVLSACDSFGQDWLPVFMHNVRRSAYSN